MSDLTAQQALGMEKIKNWYGDRGFHAIPDSAFGADVFRWFGYAGTGKTFTAARIPEALGIHRVAFGTYTGKAASVLRRSLARTSEDLVKDGKPPLPNFPVTTIHSAIYMPTTSAEARQALAECRRELERYRNLKERTGGEDQNAVGMINKLQARLPELEADARRLAFEFNPDGPWASLDLIILDEVSMVNAKLAADIESYGVPILVLGDPAQLPPVEGGGYYTDAEPDHLLTDVQRQALDNPVLELATRVRESTTGRLGLTEDDTEPASVQAAMEADQVLCWSNRRRWAMINVIRRIMERPEGIPVAGDRIMCLTNNKDLGVFNGEQFTVTGSTPGTLGPTLSVTTETGLHRDVACFSDGFQGQDLQDQAKQSGAGRKGSRMLATFAQVITVHKAQGSEWDHVYVVNETPAMISMVAKRKGSRAGIDQGRQWMYTAATRAKEKLTITAPRQGS
jgi:exodeoxyribonuclease V